MPVWGTIPSLVERKGVSGMEFQATGLATGWRSIDVDCFQGHHANTFCSHPLIACVIILYLALGTLSTYNVTSSAPMKNSSLHRNMVAHR